MHDSFVRNGAAACASTSARVLTRSGGGMLEAVEEAFDTTGVCSLKISGNCLEL